MLKVPTVGAEDASTKWKVIGFQERSLWTEYKGKRYILFQEGDGSSWCPTTFKTLNKANRTIGEINPVNYGRENNQFS